MSFIRLCQTFIYQRKLSRTIVIDCGTGFYNTGQCLFHDSILIYRIIVALKHRMADITHARWDFLDFTQAENESDK